MLFLYNPQHMAVMSNTVVVFDGFLFTSAVTFNLILRIILHNQCVISAESAVLPWHDRCIALQ
jgi:hypothetical protein